MAEKEQKTATPQTIIIKKIKKGGDGHHGGAWKVAYADFVTAMMAFFLLLWLLNVTTEVQKKGISNYFDPTQAMISRSESGSGGLLGGTSTAKDGAMTTTFQTPVENKIPPEAQQQTKDFDLSDVEDPDLEEEKRRREEERFEETKKKLEDAIENNPDLKGLKKNLQVDITPEGLRIQIVDQQGTPMFASGSARMFPKTSQLMGLVSKTIQDMPNDISIRGHTDGQPYRGRGEYTNWELSADRANASRRVLLQQGYPAEKIANVVGKSDTDHINPDNPLDPQNRRISIILLREAVAEAEKEQGGANRKNRRSERAPSLYERTRGNVQFP